MDKFKRVEKHISIKGGRYWVRTRYVVAHICKSFDTLEEAQAFKASIAKRKAERRIKRGTNRHRIMQKNSDLPTGFTERGNRISVHLAVNGMQTNRGRSYGRLRTRPEAIAELIIVRREYLKDNLRTKEEVNQDIIKNQLTVNSTED